MQCSKWIGCRHESRQEPIYCNNCEDDDSDDDQEEETQPMDCILKDIQKKVNILPGVIKRLESIEQSMSVLSDKYDNLMAEHKQSKDRINKLEKIVENTINKYVNLEKHNRALEQRMQENEQSARKNNIEIVGIEQLPDENILDIVFKIGNKMEVGTADIQTARRTRTTGNKLSSILVEFKNTGIASRDNWLSHRNNLSNVTSQDITGGSMKNKIFVNEDLTKPTKTLLWNTKKQLKDEYKFIWVHNGKILVKKAEGDRSKWVRNESDISELLKNK
ncbi:hypothetical protein ACJJTC_018032 [Scirpophaga incertulas]